MKYVVTQHANLRYRERVKDIDPFQARVAILEMLDQSVELTGPRLWRYVGDRQVLADCDYLVHPSGVVFAIKIERSKRVVMTLLTNEGRLDSPMRPPKTGNRHCGAKYRGRLSKRIGGYKRKKKIEPEE